MRCKICNCTKCNLSDLQTITVTQEHTFTLMFNQTRDTCTENVYGADPTDVDRGFVLLRFCLVLYLLVTQLTRLRRTSVDYKYGRLPCTIWQARRELDNIKINTENYAERWQ